MHIRLAQKDDFSSMWLIFQKVVASGTTYVFAPDTPYADAHAYWFGTGILNDEKGDDRYRGVFFNLGAAAHFAIGALIDQRGNDQSELVRTLGFGAAHDGSAGA